jgi:hypothetical protein
MMIRWRGDLSQILTPWIGRPARPLSEREAMLSGSAEPECRVGLPVTSPALRDAGEAAVRCTRTFLPADDAPGCAPTTMATRATILPTAEVSWRPGSTAVN